MKRDHAARRVSSLFSAISFLVNGEKGKKNRGGKKKGWPRTSSRSRERSSFFSLLIEGEKERKREKEKKKGNLSLEILRKRGQTNAPFWTRRGRKGAGGI